MVIFTFGRGPKCYYLHFTGNGDGHIITTSTKGSDTMIRTCELLQRIDNKIETLKVDILTMEQKGVDYTDIEQVSKFYGGELEKLNIWYVTLDIALDDLEQDKLI